MIIDSAKSFLKHGGLFSDLLVVVSNPNETDFPFKSKTRNAVHFKDLPKS